MSNNQNNVKKAVLDFQNRTGKTMQEIASDIGVSRVSLGKWLQKGYVSEDFVMRFADVVGVPPWTVNKLAKEMAERLSSQ